MAAVLCLIAVECFVRHLPLALLRTRFTVKQFSGQLFSQPDGMPVDYKTNRLVYRSVVMQTCLLVIM